MGDVVFIVGWIVAGYIGYRMGHEQVKIEKREGGMDDDDKKEDELRGTIISNTSGKLSDFEISNLIMEIMIWHDLYS